MLKLACFLVLASAFNPAMLWAEGDAEEGQVLLLEGITVVAPVIGEVDGHTEVAHKTVIRGEGLEERFSSLPEVLSETVGLKINRFGGLGAFSAISIRGSSSEQVLVYWDGFLLNSAQGGGGDLARVPLSQIESIEVYRGSAPVLFGQTGMGGLINIRTKDAGRGGAMAYQIQYGSFHTSGLSASLSYRPERTAFFLGINHLESDNDFEFLNNNGTQFNPSDDTVVKRKNSQFESLNVIAKMGLDLRKNRKIWLYHNFLETEKGIPGIGAFQSEQARFKTEANRSRLQFIQSRLWEHKLRLEGNLFYEAKKEAFQDRLGEIGVGNQDNENKTETTELRLHADLLVGAHQTWTTLFQFRQEQFKPFDRLRKEHFATSRRETTSIGTSDQISLFDERFLLVPSLLYDRVKNRFRGETFLARLGGDFKDSRQGAATLTRQLGLLYLLTEEFSFKANIGRYFRRPNFFELFGDRGGTIGNAELLAEEGLNWDLGFFYSKRFKGIFRRLSLQAAYFQNDVENLILFIQTSQRTSKPQNIGRAETIGQEVSGKLEIGPHLKLDANYTQQRAVNRSEIPSQRGKILPGRPVHELSAKVDLYSKHFSIFYSYHFTDQNFLDRANQRIANSRQIHNLGFSIRRAPAWSLTLEAKNLSNNQIEDVFGFPLPGRSYFLTMSGSI